MWRDRAAGERRAAMEEAASAQNFLLRVKDVSAVLHQLGRWNGEGGHPLLDMPVWTFHGKLDTVVPFEEAERIVRTLEGRNRNLRFSAEPDLGHWIHWQVYPDREIYHWFLRYDRRSRR